MLKGSGKNQSFHGKFSVSVKISVYFPVLFEMSGGMVKFCFFSVGVFVLLSGFLFIVVGFVY